MCLQNITLFREFSKGSTFFSLTVPIIPEFLYDINHPNATLDRLDQVTTAKPQATPNPCWKYINHDVTTTISSNDFDSNLTTLDPIITTLDPEAEEKKMRHKDLVQETVQVGMMFASKAFVQLLANPFVGPLTHKIGYSVPMFAGFVIMFLSTISEYKKSSSKSYSVLFIARALQGIGSSCSSVSGMGMLAERYPDDKERGNAMGIALGGLALGVLIGPPFGGVMYEFVGKSAPFLVLSALALGDG
ncbi:synaptic vesicular amine transporter, partial [Asbolus verrucosus]